MYQNVQINHHFNLKYKKCRQSENGNIFNISKYDSFSLSLISTLAGGCGQGVWTGGCGWGGGVVHSTTGMHTCSNTFL